MSKKFEENVEIWAKERPVEAMRLQYGGFSPYPWDTKQNLKTPFGKLYESDDEPIDWFKSLKSQEAKVLYIYGVGLGNYYPFVQKWLAELNERQVIILEDDYGVLYRFFETSIATKILNDKHVSLCFLSNAKDSSGVLETLYWSSVLEPFEITALKSYQKHKSAQFEELKYKIAYDRTMKNALVEEYLKYGIAFFRNFYPNMLELEGAAWGNALFGKFQGIPAIICGAGPSLGKQIELLGALKDRALIFAGGSSLNGITAHGVLPHFGAGIDPNPTQLARLNASQASGVPFFFRTRMQVDAARKIPGKKLYISGSGGYDIAEWYEKKFNLEAEFLDEGHNVVNFCTEIAHRMGCNPIIYVGMDLAYTDMKAYSPGIDDTLSISEEVLLNAQDEEYRGLYRKDIYGKPILTLWKWIAESEWLTRFSKLHPEVTYINATEGGIGFEDIPNLSLEEVIQTYLLNQYPLEKKVKEEIDLVSLPQLTKEALSLATVELKESLIRCIAKINTLLDELKMEKDKPDTKGSLVSGLAVLAESDLYEEPAYIYLLDIFHQVFARVQNKHVLHIRLNKQDLNEHALALKKIWLQEEKLQFLCNVAKANLSLIDHALNPPP